MANIDQKFSINSFNGEREDLNQFTKSAYTLLSELEILDRGFENAAARNARFPELNDVWKEEGVITEITAIMSQNVMKFTNIKNMEVRKEREAISTAKRALQIALPASSQALYTHPENGAVGVPIWKMLKSVMDYFSKLTARELAEVIESLQEGHTEGSFETFLQRSKDKHSALAASDAELSELYK